MQQMENTFYAPNGEVREYLPFMQEMEKSENIFYATNGEVWKGNASQIHPEKNLIEFLME